MAGVEGEFESRVGAVDEGAEFQADGGVVWRGRVQSFGDEDGEVGFDVAARRQGWTRVGVEGGGDEEG